MLDYFKSTRESRTIRKRFIKDLAVLSITFSSAFTMTDILSDLVYLIKSDFYSDGLKFGVAHFLILIPSIIYISSFIYYLRDYRKIRSEAIENGGGQNVSLWDSNHIHIIIWLLVGPVVSFFYPITSKFAYLAPEKLKILSKLARYEFLIESLPQIVIQGANNSLNDSWNSLARFSFAFSIMSVIRGSFIFATAIYREKYTAFLEGIENEIVSQVYWNIKNGQDFHGLNDSTLELLIKHKFYEMFDNKKFLFKSDHMPHLDILDNLHEKIEEELKNSYNLNYQYEFQSHEFFSRFKSVKNVIILIEFILMFIIWFCNILYIIIADFEIESVRYLNLFFIGVAYIISLFGIFTPEQMAAFSKVILLRMCTVSHFEELVSLLYNKEIHTEKGILSEIVQLVFAWIPIITIQADNNLRTGNSDGIYSGVIVLNSFWITMSFFRIVHRLYLNHYKTVTPALGNK